MPAAPSPSSSTTCEEGRAIRAPIAAPSAGAEAAVRARVEPAAGALGLDELAGEGHEVAAVADHDRVVGEPGEQLAVDPGRVDRVGLGAAAGRGRARRPRRPRSCSSRDPRATSRACAAAARRRSACPSRTRVRSPYAEPARSACRETWPSESATCTTRAAVAPSLPPKTPYPSRKSSGVPTTTTRSAVPKAGTAGLGHQQRVPAGYDAAAHAVGDGGEAERLHEPQGGLLGAVGPDVGAQHEHRAARLREQVADLRDRLGVRLDPAAPADDRAAPPRPCRRTRPSARRGRWARGGRSRPTVNAWSTAEAIPADVVHGPGQLRHRRQRPAGGRAPAGCPCPSGWRGRGRRPRPGGSR